MKAIISWVSVVALYLALAGRVSCGEEPPAGSSDRGAQERIQLNAIFGLRDPTFTTFLNDSLLSGNGLGIDVAPPEAALRAQLALDEGTGLVVTSAPEESAGAKAGIKAHDVLIEMNDQTVGDADNFKERLDAADGKTVVLRLLRAGKTLRLEATPKNPNVSMAKLLFHFGNDAASEEHYRIGVTLSEADDTLRTQLRLAAGEGLVVTEVVADGAAAEVGIQTHDVLIVLDGRRLTTVEAINAQIQEIKDKSVDLRLLRAGKEMTIPITPRKVREGTAANTLVLWDTQDCRRCHSDPHASAHQLMGTRLRAAHSAWTDGHHANLYRYYHQHATPAEQENSTPPQEQIQTLKSQLAELQKTLSSLEAALKPAEPKEK
jgi:hypothetical protein